MLCERPGTSSIFTISPLALCATYRLSLSHEATWSLFPSGDPAIRSQPSPSQVFSQTFFICEKIERCQPLDRAYIEPARVGVSGDTLDVLRLLSLPYIPCRYAPREFMAVVDVENQHAAAMFDFVANAGNGNVEKALLRDRRLA